MAKEKLYSIQYLRGLAAVLVVYVHAVLLQMSCGKVSFQQDFYFLKSIGAFGVDLFFIISGFIICYISGKDSGIKDFVRFVKKRFIRINPVFYILCLVLFVCFLIWSPSEYSLATILKSIIIIPVFDSGEEFIYPLIYVGWTLSYEWTFYLIYGAFIAFSIVKKREMYLITLFIFLFLLGFFFPIREIHYIFITNPMFLEFGMGMIIAVIYRNIKNINILVPVFLGLASVGIFTYLLFNGHGQIDEAFFINTGVFTWHRVLMFGIPSMLFFACFLFWEKRTSFRFPKSATLVLIGDASYSIYLVHPIIFFILYHTLKQELAFLNPDLLIVLLVAVATILGIVVHKLIENKVISALNKLLLNKR